MSTREPWGPVPLLHEIDECFFKARGDSLWVRPPHEVGVETTYWHLSSGVEKEEEIIGKPRRAPAA
jgi:hypothetical protein